MAGFWFIGKQSDVSQVALLYPNGDFVGVAGSNYTAVIAANQIPKLDVPDGVWDDMAARRVGYAVLDGPHFAPSISIVIDGTSHTAPLNPTTGHYELTLVQDTPGNAS